MRCFPVGDTKKLISKKTDSYLQGFKFTKMGRIVCTILIVISLILFICKTYIAGCLKIKQV